MDNTYEALFWRREAQVLESDRQVHSLIGAIHLRSYVRMINHPDQVVDHLIAAYTGLDPVDYTGDIDLAEKFAKYLAPDLDRFETFQLNPTLYGAKAYSGNDSVTTHRAAHHPAIPICLIGLNRRIENLTRGQIVNNLPKGVDEESSKV